MTTSAATDVRIETWRPAPDGSPSLAHDIDMLADVLHAVVYEGAGVSFVVPVLDGRIARFWVEKVLPGSAPARGASSSRGLAIASSGRCRWISRCRRTSSIAARC